MLSKIANIGLVLALLGGCGIGKDVYLRDVGGLRGQIDQLEKGNAGLHQENTARAARIAELERAQVDCQRELEARSGQLGSELKGALSRIRELEAVAARQKAVFDQLTRALDSLVRAGKLSVSIVRGQFTVQMSEKILFDSGKYRLKPEAEATLIELANILRSVPKRQFQVIGHTDTDGSAEFNWRLSGNRSRVVNEYMIEQGMPPERLTWAAAGEYHPVKPNDTPENKAQNRRIDIVLVPNLEELLAPLRGK